MSTEIDNFKTTTDTLITTKTTPRSITPANVGGQVNALADIVEAFRVAHVALISSAQDAADAAQADADTILGLIGDGTDLDTTVNKLSEALVILQNFSEGADVAGMINNKVDKVTGKSLLSDTEIARLLTLGNYTHPTDDGNLHVPATSTTNNGKVLGAGVSAGALSWVWAADQVVNGYVKAATGRVLTAADSVRTMLQILERRLEVIEQVTVAVTHAQFLTLTTSQKWMQGTVRDTGANLTAANYVYPAGWIIIEHDKTIDGAHPSNVKEADGVTAYNALEYGMFTDLMSISDTDVFEEVASKFTIKDQFLYDFVFDEIVQVWLARHGDNNPSTFNASALSGTGHTAASVAYDPTTWEGRLPKISLPSSVSTAGTGLSLRRSAILFSANVGFKFRTINRISDPATVADGKMFIGLSSNTAHHSNSTSPGSFLFSLLGYGNDSGDTNLSIISGPSGSLVKTDLGSNFPAQSQDWMDFEVTVLPGGTTATYTMTRRSPSTGLAVGTPATGTLSSIPGLTVGLAPHVWRANGTTALAIGLYFSLFWTKRGRIIL